MLLTTGTSSTRLERMAILYADISFMVWTKLKSYHLLNLLARVQRKVQPREIKKLSNNESCSTRRNTSSPPHSWPRLMRKLLMDKSLRWHIQQEVFKLSGVRSFRPQQVGPTGDGRSLAQRILMVPNPTPPIVITHRSSSRRKSLTMKVISVPIAPL